MRGLHRGTAFAALLLAVGTSSVLGGCAARAAATDRAVVGDTLRGIVQLVGTAPGVVTLVGSGAGAAPLAVLVEGAAALRAAAGLEVMVEGARSGTSDVLPIATPAFTVRRFAVRAVDGVAAVDGTLARDGERLVLQFADGRRVALVAPPAAFQDLVGARVFWVGPLDRAPSAYGVLAR